MDPNSRPGTGQGPPPAQQGNSMAYVPNPFFQTQLDSPPTENSSYPQTQPANPTGNLSFYETQFVHPAENLWLPQEHFLNQPENFSLPQGQHFNHPENFSFPQGQSFNHPGNISFPQAQPGDQPNSLVGYQEFPAAEQAPTSGPPPSVQQGFQQPLPQASQHSHPPTLTFEQRKARFRPTPVPHPNPLPRPGQGRKKNDRPFWAPAGADHHLMTKHKKLDEAHNRVCMAEKKLAKNTKPSQTEHCEKMVLRNMELRENLRSECERIERGETAGLTVEEAYAKTKGLAEKMLARGASCYRNDERLRLKYPEAVGADGKLDTTKLNKKDRESQVSTSNWFKNAHSKLTASFPDLLEAMEGDPNYHFASKTLVSTFHSLGCYTAGSCWLWPMRPDIQMQFSNPDPITWPCAPQPEQSPPLAGYQAQPDQSSAQHHQEAQPMEIDFPGISEAYRLIDQAGNAGSQSAQTQQPEEPQGQEQNHDTEMTEPVELTDEELEAEFKVLIAALEDTPVQAPPEERLEERQTDETNIDPSLRILAAATARGFSQEATSAGDQTTAPSEGHEKAQINYDELVKDVGGRTFTDAEMFDCATNPGC